MSLGPDDWVLCAGTCPAAGLAERIVAAADAGFRGVSVYLDDLDRAAEDGYSDADLRALLRENGVEVAELDCLLRWLPEKGLAATSAEGEGFLRWGEEDFYRAADRLGGARSINAVLYADTEVPLARVVEGFGGLCERAAQHALLVHLEFLPWTQIGSLRAALDVVLKAGQPNGGIMLDTWHHYRSGAGVETLAGTAGERILAVQLADAPAEAEADLVKETLHRRRLPGEGDADLRGLVRGLRAAGCRAPLGVEVFSDALARLPAEEVARRAATAALAVVSEG